MIVDFTTTDLRLESGVWPFAEARRDEIAAFWAEKTAANPTLWDGRVLSAFAPRIEGGVFSARMLETAFSAFLAWRDWGFPDATCFNVFGSAILAGDDGAILFGVMAAHTSNAGAIYPCGGSLEPGDVGADGRVDVWGSVAREVREETGLEATEGRPAGSFLVRTGQLMSVCRVIRFALGGAALARRIEANIAAQSDPELSGVVVVRQLADLDRSRAPAYAVEAARHVLGG